MNEPILITGASRSGTSMVAGIVHLCGVFGGNVTPQNKDTSKSMFENTQILNGIVKPYLHSVGADVEGQFPLPDIENLIIPVNWSKRVLDVLQSQGYTGGSWMYKSTKTALIYPVWHYAFPNAKWVIVRRKDEDIVESCLRTAFMNAFNNPENIQRVGAKDERDAWFWWVRQHNRRFVEMIESGVNCMQVHPERMIRGDYSQIHQMLEWLGLRWSSEIPNYMEPKLWKARKTL